MKKLMFQIAALIVSAICASISPAHAGVPCSVPFNLTNGTTADATQVMANYNAILTCLSTSTAASGINTDITSLGGLTTPITPAQGGAVALCGASNFIAKNNATFPNTQIDFSWNQALVTNAVNAVQFGAAGTTTLNFSTTGVDGLDTGTQTATTTYYTYLIGNGSVIHSLASLSSTAPTMPATYTYLCRVGSIRTMGSTNLYTFFQQGRTVSITSSLSGDANYQNTGTNGTCATPVYAATAFNGVPATAGYANGYIFSNANNEGKVGVGRTASSDIARLSGIVESGVNGAIFLPFTAPMITPSQVFWCNDTSGAQGITINGWIDSVNVN